MGFLTNFLGLFKYDPSTDGLDTFNIETALNENWDKIDVKAKATEDAITEHKDDNTIHYTSEGIQDIIGSLIQAGSNVSITYDDQNNQLQISSNYVDTNTQRSDEEIQDVVNALLTPGSNVNLSYDDTTNQLTITSNYVNTQRSDEEIRDVIGAVIQSGNGINVTVNDSGNTITVALSVNGTDTDVNTSGAMIIDSINVTKGIVTSMGTRNLTPSDIGTRKISSGSADPSNLDEGELYFQYE